MQVKVILFICYEFYYIFVSGVNIIIPLLLLLSLCHQIESLSLSNYVGLVHCKGERLLNERIVRSEI